MVGIITMRQVVGHPYLVVHGFGWKVFGRCLLAVALRQRRTFLELACA